MCSLDTPSIVVPSHTSRPLSPVPVDSDLTLDMFTFISNEGDVCEGNSAVVRVARGNATGEVVALKQLRLAHNDDGLRRVILSEMQALQGPHHENVVRMHGAFCHEASVFIVLEFVDGGSLEDLLRGGRPIPEHIIRFFAWQILQGLRHLHCERHIIHRDIKPSNVLLTREGLVKIADFGVSSQLQSSMGQANTWVGTVTYMSPDRINGSSQPYPYPHACNYWKLLETVVEGPVPRLPEGFSPLFQDFLDKCLQKDPRNRVSVEKLLDHPFISNNPCEAVTWEQVAQWLHLRRTGCC